MNTPLIIDIAGISIAFNCKHEILLQALSRRYRDFIISHTPQYQITIEWSHSGDFVFFDPPEVIFLTDGIQVVGSGLRGYIDLFQQQGSLEISEASPIESIDYFLRVVTAELIFNLHGMMIHGAGILHHGKGYLFIGQSGSGKTTVSKLSLQDNILNDDLIILLPCVDGWNMYSTPFWNPSQIAPKPSEALLSTIFRLVQSKTVSIESYKPGQALAEVIANIPIIAKDVSRSPILVERCLRLLNTVPVYQLRFTPDDSFWQEIQIHQGT